MRFSLTNKHLKEIIDKGSVALVKKSSVAGVSTLYFEVTDEGTLSVSATDLDQYLKINTDSTFDTEPGMCGVDIDDLKMLTKGTGVIECNTISDHELSVKYGNKTLVVPCRDVENDPAPVVPVLEDKYNSCQVTMPESWLYETFMNLATFTNPNDGNRMMRCIHMNLKEHKAEALDGHRIGVRNIPDDMIEHIGDGGYVVTEPAIATFKKILDKKSNNPVSMYANEEYVWFIGSDFRYIVKRYKAEYFKVKNMMSAYQDANFQFTVNRDDVLSVTKYLTDMAKGNIERKPMMICYTNGSLYSYYHDYRYETVDKIEAKNIIMDDGFTIGVNPKFIMDAMQVIDVDEPMVYMINAKSPITINSDDYSLLVLPVNFIDDAGGETIANRIKTLARKTA